MIFSCSYKKTHWHTQVFCVQELVVKFFSNSFCRCWFDLQLWKLVVIMLQGTIWVCTAETRTFNKLWDDDVLQICVNLLEMGQYEKLLGIYENFKEQEKNEKE